MASPISYTPACPERGPDSHRPPGQISSHSQARSWRRDVSRADRRTVFSLDHPSRAFVELRLRRLEDAPPDQLFDQLLHHVAVRAQDDIVQVWIAEKTKRSLQPGALGQLPSLVHRQPPGQ